MEPPRQQHLTQPSLVQIHATCAYACTACTFATEQDLTPKQSTTIPCAATSRTILCATKIMDIKFMDIPGTFITFGPNYNIEDSTCECVNVQDKCHHKASILLFGYKNVSKTDVRQSWIKNPKSAPPRQTKTMEELFPAPDRFVNYRTTNRPVNDRDREFLYHKLTSVRRFSAMHWILVPEPPVTRLSLPIVEDLISSQEFISSENPIVWMKQKLMINEQQIQQIASLTIGQKDICLWSSVRKNRLTASNFGCVLAAIKRNRYPISLYKRLCSAYDLSKKNAIIWGMCNEKIAIEKYKTFGDAVVEPTGGYYYTG
uniref:YqaJ viral recombinase domain-containing protein n=1 Tax=Magallana gigas TaxID=29159 RepID=A0A8W8MLH2_MAGGI